MKRVDMMMGSDKISPLVTFETKLKAHIEYRIEKGMVKLKDDVLSVHRP